MGSSYISLQSATSTIDSAASNRINFESLGDIGIIPRIITDLFARIEDEQNRDKEAKFSVSVSFLEIYNEELKDLFSPKPANGEPLKIREENGKVRVAGLEEINVPNAIASIQQFKKGSSLRAVGGTAMNEQSSRSHAVFTLTLEQTRAKNSKKSKFHLVDLAGTERQDKTQANEMQLKEGISNNKALFILGRVMSILDKADSTNKASHVPYRDSRLTWLLQDSLGGNSVTEFIACISPADSNKKESLSTLRVAVGVRNIEN